MESSESVSEWLAQLKQGDPVAAQKLWQRYVGQLVRLARRKLGRSPRRVADEEDVVAAAFASFCRGAEAGRFARLADRDDLWQVLVVLTERKAIDQLRRQRAAKRGAGRVLGQSALGEAKAEGSAGRGIDQLVGREPTPQLAAEIAEQLERLLAALDDAMLRRVALEKMEGYTNREIAQRLRISLRSVERQLGLIRQIWQQGLLP